MTQRLTPTALGASLFLWITSGLLGQAPAAAPAGSKLEFEVASVKPAAPMTGGMMRIGMRVDEGRMDYANVSLKDCIRTAYRLKDFQVVGPDWMGNARFDIVAKLPEGATKDQVPEMLQALLADRFKIVVHHESKPHDSYALVVAKNGPKLTASAPDDKDESAGGGKSFGGPSVSSGSASTGGGGGGTTRTMVFSSAGGGGGGGGAVGGGAMGAHTMDMSGGNTMKMQLKKQTLTGYAELLARFLGSPVTDLTEIQGTYDFTLELSLEDLTRGSGISLRGKSGAGAASASDTSNPADSVEADSGGAIFKSVANYGLKLDKRKAPMDLLVVDHIEKAPTEN